MAAFANAITAADENLQVEFTADNQMIIRARE